MIPRLLDSAELRSDTFQSIRRKVAGEESFVVATITAGPDGVGSKTIIGPSGEMEEVLGSPSLERVAGSAALELLPLNRSESRELTADGAAYTVFFDVHVPPPRLIIVGAVQTAQSLTRMAKELGYRVIVTDARATFATEERFPEADEVVKGWPQDVLPRFKMDGSTYLVLLSHDPKFDEPTLHFALPHPVRYIGAIGSRRTQEQRRERLAEQGFTPEMIAKIHGPVGLDLGGKAAEEVALAILAEMTAVRYGRAA